MNAYSQDHSYQGAHVHGTTASTQYVAGNAQIAREERGGLYMFFLAQRSATQPTQLLLACSADASARQEPARALVATAHQWAGVQYSLPGGEVIYVMDEGQGSVKFLVDGVWYVQLHGLTLRGQRVRSSFCTSLSEVGAAWGAGRRSGSPTA